jgi:hypothetical protein
MSSGLDEPTLKQIIKWLRHRPTEHATTETSAMVREFEISLNMARLLRALAGRDQHEDCTCCESVGDHACGGECQHCSGTGRNPVGNACVLPHGLDCTCSWPGEV